MRTIAISLFLLLLTAGVQAQIKKSAPRQIQKTESIESQMQNYFMVILTKGPHRDQDSLSLDKLQKGHMANIERLAGEGKLILAGPFLDDGMMRGIFVFNVATGEEVKKLVDTDPMVISGRMAYEIHPWMGPKKLVSLLVKTNKPGK